ncbi:MAG TPA: toll/interleukin-1 receptor domain-containing protein [Rhodanobacter sp.]|nr:toll/interleukin-1 receptor domain-containing protein [Rhodanobacter sp.]
MSSLFFSYSHKDETLRDQLEVHLAVLKREGAISTWHDRRIMAGDVLGQRIDEELEHADIILLLISPDFLASDYCHDVEMQRALARHAERSARVIPVILRSCDWQHSPFAGLLAAPTDGRPVTKWPDLDEAFLDVVRQIRAALPPTAHASPHRNPLSAVSPMATAASGPRSSNLRLRKQFSDADRDQFVEDVFDYMARYFENSLRELATRNPAIEGRYKRLDAQRFSAVIYEAGQTRAQCSIRLGGCFGKGITYSASADAAGNSYHGMLSLEHDDQHLYLSASMSMMGGDRDQQLTFEGAAEHYWAMLIEPLQH